MRRQARLFAIAEHLRSRRTGITAESLAERFNVTVRTIYRDLDALREAQLPLRADRGRGGGYALDRAYTLPPVNFTAREAAILCATGRWIARLRLLPFTETLASALDKVRGALPSSAQLDLNSLEESISFVGVPARAPAVDIRRAIETAWLDRRVLRIEYDGARGITRRRIRIRSIVMERTETLLNTTDLDKNEERQFAMHKIVSAQIVAD
jgi:predicted DNA-binding transcriptional regulator YafY